MLYYDLNMMMNNYIIINSKKLLEEEKHVLQIVATLIYNLRGIYLI